MTLSLFSIRREEAGEEPTSPVTYIHAAPPGRKMFACAKLARTPALVRNPGFGPAFTPRDRLSFTLAPCPLLPPSQPWGLQTVPGHVSPEA